MNYDSSFFPKNLLDKGDWVCIPIGTKIYFYYFEAPVFSHMAAHMMQGSRIISKPLKVQISLVGYLNSRPYASWSKCNFWTNETYKLVKLEKKQI